MPLPCEGKEGVSNVRGKSDQLGYITVIRLWGAKGWMVHRNLTVHLLLGWRFASVCGQWFSKCKLPGSRDSRASLKWVDTVQRRTLHKTGENASAPHHSFNQSSLRVTTFHVSIPYAISSAKWIYYLKKYTNIKKSWKRLSIIIGRC